jgi:hypothetical protein
MAANKPATDDCSHGLANCALTSADTALGHANPLLRFTTCRRDHLPPATDRGFDGGEFAGVEPDEAAGAAGVDDLVARAAVAVPVH